MTGFEVDPAFKSTGQKSRKRQAVRRTRRMILLAVAGVVGLLVVGLATFLLWPDGSDDPPVIAEGGDASDPTAPLQDDFVPLSDDPDLGEGGDDFETATFVQTEGSAEMGIAISQGATASDAFLHLPGDPMILQLDTSDEAVAVRLPGPSSLSSDRAGPLAPDRISAVTDALVLGEKRLVTTIPSSSEDLALFQARRSQGIAELTAEAEALPAAVDDGEVVVVSGDDGSWGELIGEDGTAAELDTATYVETVIENTTTIGFAVRERDRLKLYEDIIVVLQIDRDLTEVLTSNGFEQDEAERIAQAANRLFGLEDALPARSIVALRMGEEVGGRVLLQMSYYSPEAYEWSLARIGAGRYAASADPWVEDDLLSRSGELRRTASVTGEIRLIDALYSAAIRNGLPTSLVGELIVMMSQAHDLDRFAAEGDKVTILYLTDETRYETGAGRLLFVGIDGPSGEMPCYVTPKEGEDGLFGCYDFSRGSAAGAGRLGTSGFIVPVSGTKTSDFGPRFHPVLKQNRNHNGVDWAAPTGTPVYAASGGRVAVAGLGGGYGNVVYIDHPGGEQTRYAHLDQIGPGISAGVQVTSGQVIGYVGTTGRSTGPHLHFELWVNGTPVNPLSYVGSGGGSTAPISDGGQPGTQAVEALVNQIILVESGGKATVCNPRSTACGLGQFINSTWIRMMNTYRPDLVATMTREQLLNLRNDPELSREMVRNLARENEAFLRARGYQITPGRLYLAHFLGPAGAHTALSSDPNATVLDVMGAAVVNANPFLRGKTIGDLTAWADRKMRGASSAPAYGASAPVVVRIPPEIELYRTAIDEILKEL